MTEHKQVRTSEILGHYRPCVFSRTGNGDHPFKYEPCRSQCNGLDTLCPAYIPTHNSRQTKPTTQDVRMTSRDKTADTFIVLDVLEDGTDPNQYILMMARVNRTQGRKFLYKDLTDWIRRNDRGAI